MKYIVCTLFEQHYHFGAAALINSLGRAGFTGTICAGFRGALPPWTEGRARMTAEGRWEMEVSPGVRVLFLALATPVHFTNYKADFLLQAEALARESEGAIYCDPDIVINGDWRYVEDWLSCGVAVCEDVNSPLGQNHPRRVGWRRFFQPLGFDLAFRGADFANGGFVGVRWEHRDFLVTWQRFLAAIASELGGGDVVGIEGGRTLNGSYGFADCFRNTDQDALNAALEACPEIPLSFLGRQAMGFQAGYALLPHALGRDKPWRRRFVREALGGVPPREVDKAFWRNVEGPLRPFSTSRVFFRKLELRTAAGLGRLIRRA